MVHHTPNGTKQHQHQRDVYHMYQLLQKQQENDQFTTSSCCGQYWWFNYDLSIKPYGEIDSISSDGARYENECTCCKHQKVTGRDRMTCRPFRSIILIKECDFWDQRNWLGTAIFSVINLIYFNYGFGWRWLSTVCIFTY